MEGDSINTNTSERSSDYDTLVDSQIVDNNKMDSFTEKDKSEEDAALGLDAVVSNELDGELKNEIHSLEIIPRIKKPTPPVALEAHALTKKPKLRTSKDVYDRLKWNSKSVVLAGENDSEQELSTSNVHIGYKDRFLGMCELPFEDFEPGGDLPYHRIYYFRTGGPPVNPFIGKDGEVKVREDNLPEDSVFIWDRESRTDLVFRSGNSTIIKKRTLRSHHPV